MDPLTDAEREFLEIMHKFPLGYNGDDIMTGKWFEQKDLLASVKALYALNNKIREKRNSTRTNSLSIEAGATEYLKTDDLKHLNIETKANIRVGFAKGATWMRDVILDFPQA